MNSHRILLASLPHIPTQSTLLNPQILVSYDILRMSFNVPLRVGIVSNNYSSINDKVEGAVIYRAYKHQSINLTFIIQNWEWIPWMRLPLIPQ